MGLPIAGASGVGPLPGNGVPESPDWRVHSRNLKDLEKRLSSGFASLAGSPSFHPAGPRRGLEQFADGGGAASRGGEPFRVFCLNCRHLSPSGPNCQSCGAPLAQRSAPPSLASPLEELRQWTLELRSGDLDPSQFLGRLDQREASLRRVLENLEALDIPGDMLAEVQEELQTGRRGIQGFLEALTVLREWAGSGQPEDLDRGMALATQANSLVNQAVRLNWKTFQTYQEAAEEFLEQAGYQGT